MSTPGEDLGTPAAPAPPRRGVGRWLASPYPWALVLGIATLTLIRPLLRHEPEPPPVLGELPPFELVAASGEPFGLDDLEGRVWVVNFFFTRCGAICPRLTAAMHSLQERYEAAGTGPGLGLLSVTVDPDHDTPEVLGDYARRHDVDAGRWTFLTGDRAAVERLVEQGFRTAIGPPGQDEAGWIDIAHSGRLVLVDRRGRIRGYYETDAAGLDETFHRSLHVLRERLVE